MKITKFWGIPFQNFINVAPITTPRRVIDTPTRFSRCTIYARKGWNSTSANTGTVYLGWRSDGQPIELAPGDGINIEAPDSVIYDLQDLWIRVDTAQDGIVYLAYP